MQNKAGRHNKKRLNAVQNLSAANVTKTPQQRINKRNRAKYDCSKKLGEMIRQANLVKNVQNFSLDTVRIEYEFESFLTTWYRFFLSLPKDVRSFVFLSDERREFDKQDGYEYWINNFGEAEETLNNLNADGEISDDLFNKLINSSDDEIADFLVDWGYYRGEYSYKEQQERKQEKKLYDFSLEYDSKKEKSDYSDFSLVAAYMGALNRLHSVREFLLSIINLAKNIDFSTASTESDSFQVRRKQDDLTRSITKELTEKELKDKILATSIKINEKGEIYFSISEWAEALQNVDVTRIRVCEVCEDIFWANRKDAFACSPRHAKVRQMRLLRANWKKNENLYLNARKRKAKKNKEK